MAVEQPDPVSLAQGLFQHHNDEAFENIALDVFRFQYAANPLYREFCNLVHRPPPAVNGLSDLPFLPISFFKTHPVQAGSFEPEAVFTSSGTTGSTQSRHQVKDLALYRHSFREAFALFYGPVQDWCILGLLPSYLERQGSSLVYMVNHLVQASGHAGSGFYLHDHDRLAATLQELEAAGQKTMLFGVSFALLDFAERHPLPLRHTVVMETGGMKGRREEWPKEALYETLRTAFATPAIHSEYGMTELLSQAYAVNGRYRTPPWMRLLLRDETDPFAPAARSGAVNVIDLANLWSCSFVATDDRGRRQPDGSLEILGRLDNSDIRGCSQMVD